MNHFFKVKSLEQVMELVPDFPGTGSEEVHLSECCSRILAREITAHQDMPGFQRSTMDGYAVAASSTYGASEANPAWLTMAGTIAMGEVPDFTLEPGQAARISTGGMLPKGADGVVMVEHAEAVGKDALEVYKSIAPMQHVIDRAEDFARGQKILESGTLIRPQEAGLAAALGFSQLTVFKRPRIGILSTGDEVVPVNAEPAMGEIRDINSYTLASLVQEAGAEPVLYGIVQDDAKALFDAVEKGVKETDMLLISGGSSVGVRDFTVDVFSSLKDTEILVHGISISPGKPTILAKSGDKSVWGLPGHVVSAMVVFRIVVLPFLKRIQGCSNFLESKVRIPALLTRNISSAQGRRDFVRMRFSKKNGELFVEPVLGKSGLIRTMVHADGLLEINENVEGVEKDSLVEIIPL
ncbi:MAG: gephyrin-like molybdotransferase Glp [Thermodesulfobacteriota bacterium]|nr:gephyrin-like molybdotransferase Glp [Thermodesulfobacteriota bacterium]